EAYGASVVLGVTQFTSPALRVHSRFGPLRILVASLELHTAERTFVYECDLAAWRGGGLPDEDEPSFLLDPSDSAALARMQDDIAARRAEFHVLPPGLLGGPGAARLPILRVERVASSAETA
ncbi:MAG TPA: hypothetical protein VMD59_03765, partial [Acidimicrobiales bacterium]|nr:hypothetical protein [Acidimicrobiales bacterium]